MEFLISQTHHTNSETSLSRSYLSAGPASTSEIALLENELAFRLDRGPQEVGGLAMRKSISADCAGCGSRKAPNFACPGAYRLISWPFGEMHVQVEAFLCLYVRRLVEQVDERK